MHGGRQAGPSGAPSEKGSVTFGPDSQNWRSVASWSGSFFLFTTARPYPLRVGRQNEQRRTNPRDLAPNCQADGCRPQAPGQVPGGGIANSELLDEAERHFLRSRWSELDPSWLVSPLRSAPDACGCIGFRGPRSGGIWRGHTLRDVQPPAFAFDRIRTGCAGCAPRKEPAS